MSCGRGGQGAEPCQESFQARAILVVDGQELDAEAVATIHVTDNGVRFDAALGNEKVEPGGHAFFDAEMRSLDEHAVDVDIQDAGDVVEAVAAPADPDVFRGRYPR